MIHGIGTDIVDVARIQAGLDRHGDKFARRILAEQEIAGFDASASPAQYLAKRFAAKEAAVKALGTGFRDGISLRHIAVNHDLKGKPDLHFSGRAREVSHALGIGDLHLSVSDEQNYAVAFVVLMCDRQQSEILSEK